MENFIKDTLKKQMQILSERSVRENGEYLAPITEQMIELAKLLDPEVSLSESDLNSGECESGLRKIINEEIDKRNRKFAEEMEQAMRPTLYIKLLRELHKVIDDSEKAQPAKQKN